MRLALFLKVKKRYEFQVAEKRKMHTMRTAPYTVSSGQTLLKYISPMEQFHEVAPGIEIEQVTSDHMKALIESFATRND